MNQKLFRYMGKGYFKEIGMKKICNCANWNETSLENLKDLGVSVAEWIETYQISHCPWCGKLLVELIIPTLRDVKVTTDTGYPRFVLNFGSHVFAAPFSIEAYQSIGQIPEQVVLVLQKLIADIQEKFKA